MSFLRQRWQLSCFVIPWVFITLVESIRVDLYLNKDKFGEFLRMDINEKGCTNVPLNWDNQAISLDTHGSCIKFYDLPYCRGKYVALQPYHSTFQDNLEALGFKHLISSASPCGPKVPSGRYYILNGADGSVLTIDRKNSTVIAKTMPFKPYITKNQQYQIDKISLADYEIIPRVHEQMNPLTFDMSVSTRQHPVRRTWKIESVYRGKYVIKNEWNNRCLYKSESGKVEEHECVAWSPNQEWMFKAIKVQPFFPSKDQLTQNPIRPDEQLPFHPQEDVFPQFHIPRPHILPGQPLRPPPQGSKKNNKKKKPQSDLHQPVPNKAFERPNPIVVNPREPFPPVQPVPIFPSSAYRLPPVTPGQDPSKPPVPHVQHPGRLPFPMEPQVTDQKKPLFPPTLFYQFRPTPQPPKIKTKGSGEDGDEEEDEEKEDAEEDSSKEKDQKDEDPETSKEKEEPKEDDPEVEEEEGSKERPEEEEEEDDDKGGSTEKKGTPTSAEEESVEDEEPEESQEQPE